MDSHSQPPHTRYVSLQSVLCMKVTCERHQSLRLAAVKFFALAELRLSTSIYRFVCCISCADRKLLLVVRHGQAWSNYWQDELGPDVWYDVVRQCTYKEENGSEYRIFDAREYPWPDADQARHLFWNMCCHLQPSLQLAK